LGVGHETGNLIVMDDNVEKPKRKAKAQLKRSVVLTKKNYAVLDDSRVINSTTDFACSLGAGFIHFRIIHGSCFFCSLTF
jgi:hypothetical protein